MVDLPAGAGRSSRRGPARYTPRPTRCHSAARRLRHRSAPIQRSASCSTSTCGRSRTMGSWPAPPVRAIDGAWVALRGKHPGQPWQHDEATPERAAWRWFQYTAPPRPAPPRTSGPPASRVDGRRSFSIRDDGDRRQGAAAGEPAVDEGQETGNWGLNPSSATEALVTRMSDAPGPR